MSKISAFLKFAAVGSILLLAACTDKPKAVETAPPPNSMSSSTTSSIVPGSAEDLRVNVGDTVHFDYDAYNITDEGRSVATQVPKVLTQVLNGHLSGFSHGECALMLSMLQRMLANGDALREALQHAPPPAPSE